ncbi:MAG: lamin tail domain-containing protein, partial [Myxococcota bacterium]
AAAEGASLVWSPRTNISLYGVTAPFPMARRLGVNIALGTDWPSSGSQNMLRELACADELDRRNYDDAFTDRQLVDMATQNAASALKSDARIGRLASGLEADVAIFDASIRSGYRAIIEGEPATVALVLRSGTPLYGDAEPMDALRSSGCEPMDVCGTPKRVCVQGDSGTSLAQVQAAVSPSTIELFSCGVPVDEPTCVPFRSGEFLGVPGEVDQDGDGVMDMLDNCPTVFNPVLPLDPPMTQANADGDMDGDLCDVCPLDADSTTCSPPNPEDRDGDMVPNGMDNCPDLPNPDQVDGDQDAIGDACDRCPDFANPGNSSCPANIYGIKQGNDTGEVLIENAIVTAVGVNGYNLQIASGDPDYDLTLGADYSGLFVFDRDSPRPSVGDRVDVEGAVNVFFGQTQLAASRLILRSSGNAGPPPLRVDAADIATGGSRAEALEGVLVEVQNVSVVDAAPDEGQFFEFVVTGNLRVDDFYYRADPFPVLGQSLGFVRGPLRFANDNFKVVPRDASDLDQAPVLVGLEPASSFVLEMSGAVSLTLRLSRAADADVAVAVSTTGPLSAPSVVTVPAGASEVAVSVTPGGARPAPAQVTATLGSSMVSAALRVYSDAEPRSVITVDLDQPGVNPGGTVEGTVELDIPGAAGGTPVSLSFSPALASASALTVPAGATRARFTVTAGADPGITTLTAAAAGGQAQSSLQISAVGTAAPSSPGDLFISEIMKNPAVLSDNEGEWIEIYNPSSSVIYELQGCTISDADGDSFSVASSLAVAPGAYVTLAKSSMPGFSPSYDWGGSSNMNLANGDDEVIVSCGGMEIDRVDYTDAAFPDVAGASMQLSLPLLQGMSPHVANDTGASFCSGSATYNGADLGTPGTDNGPC